MGEDEVVKEGMELIVEIGGTGHIFKIEIDIGEVKLDIVDGKDDIVNYINYDHKIIGTIDTVTVEELLSAIKSSESTDKLYLVDVYNNRIDDASRKVNALMKLEINRGGSSVYYTISAFPVLSFLDETVIRREGFYELFISSGKTVQEVLENIITEDAHKEFYIVEFFIKMIGKEILTLTMKSWKGWSCRF